MSSFLMAFIFFWAAAGTPQPAAESKAHVAISVKASAPLKAGSTGTFSLIFRPNKGIHINTEPAIEIVAEKNPVIASVGSITPSKNSKGYVDTSKPVKISASVSPSAPKGTHTVKVKVVYFLCSDVEGWCNRDEQTLDLRVTVK
jgi:hypothetical protein